jgi:3-oxoadipate enol-lactonase
MWKPQVEILSPNYRVITYDVRGHGESDVGDGQYLLEFFVDDFVGLLDYMHIEKAIVMGLSMGGYIALRVIERNPERFRALVLCDTRSEADTNEGKVKRATSIKTVKTQGVKTFAEEFVKAVFAPQTFQTNPDAVNFIKDIIEHNSPIGICGTLLALASRTDTTTALPNIAVPTLILVGEHDALTPPSASEAMKEKISNAELQIIPNAAHMSNLENPEVFNDALLGFLAK